MTIILESAEGRELRDCSNIERTPDWILAPITKGTELVGYDHYTNSGKTEAGNPVFRKE